MGLAVVGIGLAALASNDIAGVDVFPLSIGLSALAVTLGILGLAAIWIGAHVGHSA